jgi:hypothetical protein
MGTCVANLPAGTMMMSVSNVQASNIGDGFPDVLVTQVADPSTSYDRYEFTDVNGVRVGNSLDIVLNNITPIGTWVADFYEATGTTILTAGFTKTERAIRLWAADFSSFGINATNISSIAYFRIGLSGTSDVAFVAYNTTTITVQQVLPLPAVIRNRPEVVQNNPREQKMFSVFPNPVTGSVNFSHPKANGNETILIYNMHGALILRSAPTAGSDRTTLPVYGLLPGSYQVIFYEGRKKYFEKFIVR